MKKIISLLSKDYAESVDNLQDTIASASEASQKYAGLLKPNLSQFWGSVLFTHLITRSVSFFRLLPKVTWTDELPFWDHSTLSGIARSLIEVRLTFFYLCVDEISDDERLLRKKFFDLHDCISRMKLILERPHEASEYSGHLLEIEKIRSSIKSNPAFDSFKMKRKKQLLRGDSAFILPLEEIAARVGDDGFNYRYLQRFLSNQVHAFPMAFYSVGFDDLGKGVYSPKEEQVATGLTNIANEKILSCTSEYCSLYT